MQRSSFLISAVPLAACATAACAGKPGEAFGLVETAAQFDRKAFERAVETGAQFRQVWDAGAIQPRILGGVKNGLNGLNGLELFGFDVAASNIDVAFVPAVPTVGPASGTAFTVTATGAGNAAITFTDQSGRSAQISVTVTISTGVIGLSGRPSHVPASQDVHVQMVDGLATVGAGV